MASRHPHADALYSRFLFPLHVQPSDGGLLNVESLLALRGKNVLPFGPVNYLHIPWDFVLILLFLGILVPWRGAARMKSLLSKPELTSTDRLSLYSSTILFQWIIVAAVAWRSVARTVSPVELGLASGHSWLVMWTSLVLTGLLCANQMIGLRRVTAMPEGQRGSLFAITEKIMPRSPIETLVFSALACTAGLSEEFLYRGFVFMEFARMAVTLGSPNAIAAILSSVWFSLAHLYQGRRGIITTFVVGMIFATIRIWTGSLVPSIAAHIGIDLVAGICVSRFLRRT